MTKPSPWYKSVKFLTREVVFRLLGGIRIMGQERFPKEGPVLVAPVHVSYMDPMIVGCTCPRPLCFMAKKELFKHPLMNKALRSLASFPVERGTSDTAAIRLAIDILKTGGCLLVFPEGTRGDGVTFGEIKPGIAMLAKRSGATVVPVGIHGSHRMLPRDRKGLKRTRITVVYGEPVSYDKVEAEGDPSTARERFTQSVIDGLDRACKEAGMNLLPFTAETVS